MKNTRTAIAFFTGSTLILKLLQLSGIWFLKDYLYIYAAIIFLYLPSYWSIKKRDRDIYEITSIKNLREKTKECAILILLVFPIYTSGFYIFHAIMLGKTFILIRPPDLFSSILFHTFFAALPEETFYRGFIQELINRDFGKNWNTFGIKWGPSVIITSLLFAIGHYIIIPHPFRLAVFFPSLLFGILKEKDNNITLPFIFHALSNIYSTNLEKMFI